jgi:hypothetical protein
MLAGSRKRGRTDSATLQRVLEIVPDVLLPALWESDCAALWNTSTAIRKVLQQIPGQRKQLSQPLLMRLLWKHLTAFCPWQKVRVHASLNTPSKVCFSVIRRGGTLGGVIKVQRRPDGQDELVFVQQRIFREPDGVIERESEPFFWRCGAFAAAFKWAMDSLLDALRDMELRF